MLLRIGIGLALLLQVAVLSASDPVSIRVVAWNVQSDWSTARNESDPDLIQQQMAAKSGVHLWGLSEVLNATDLAKFKAGAEDGESTEFGSILGTTGNRDRLAVLYDKARFDLLGSQELGMIQINSGLRAPLVAHLKGKRTGQEFKFVVNHLKRGGAQNPVRIEQAKRLNQWVQTQTLPVIMVGDFNFDYDIELGDHSPQNRDQGFDEVTKEDRFRWIRPERLLKTHADDEFNSILDFVFVGNVPFGWFATSRILEQAGDAAAAENDFDDDEDTSDHRPVDAVFTLGPPEAPPAPAGVAGREALLQKLQQLEQQVQELRALISQLPN